MEKQECRDNRLTHRACHLFMSADRMHRKAFERLVVSLGIHRSQHFMLMNIAREGASSQKELATRLGISTAAVAVALKKLEADGYITRTADSNDSRNNLIEITEEGSRVVSVSREYFSEVDAAMFHGIDEERLSVFISCLEAIQDNLSAFLDAKEKEDV